MVVGIGIDMVDIERLEGVLERHPDRAADRLFNPTELADCAEKANPSECLAARFAAKEAFLKALGTGLRDGIAWREISLRTDPHGRPHIEASGAAAERVEALGASSIHVSITHDGGLATAVVLLQTD
ncbi:MAG: holo-ACP synthase [Gemmatimonadota bacterium]|nr:holo-ACP synthase [Gemmatimonadota bacterium]